VGLFQTGEQTTGGRLDFARSSMAVSSLAPAVTPMAVAVELYRLVY